MSTPPNNPWDNQPNAGAGVPPTPGAPQVPPVPGGTPGAGVPPTGGPGAPGPQQFGQAAPGQPGFGQPGFGGPGAPPPAPKKNWKPWLLGCGGLFLLGLLLCGGCLGWAYFSTKGSIDNANDFVAAVKDGDDDRAADFVSGDCSASNAIAALESGGEIGSYSLTGVNNTNGNVTVSGTIELDGVTRTVEFDMDGDKVCRVFVG